MKIDDTLSAEFGIQPMGNTEVITKTGEVINDSTNKIQDDFDITRYNLRILLQQGQEALQKSLDVAMQSEHPRAFEVVGNLMKQLADINQQLLDLHQQKQKLDEPSKAEKAKQVTNNNAIFVGSTAELNKLIKKMNTGE
jgi:hypothetical protein